MGNLCFYTFGHGKKWDRRGDCYDMHHRHHGPKILDERDRHRDCIRSSSTATSVTAADGLDSGRPTPLTRTWTNGIRNNSSGRWTSSGADGRRHADGPFRLLAGAFIQEIELSLRVTNSFAASNPRESYTRGRMTQCKKCAFVSAAINLLIYINKFVYNVNTGQKVFGQTTKIISTSGRNMENGRPLNSGQPTSVC